MAYPAALFLICAPPEAVAVVNAQESSAVASASVVETEEEPVAAAATAEVTLQSRRRCKACYADAGNRQAALSVNKVRQLKLLK